MADEEMKVAGAFMRLRVELLGHEEDVRRVVTSSCEWVAG